MGQQESCIAQHFSHYGRLSENERRQLDALEAPATVVTKGQVLWHEGDAARNFCTLGLGWAYSFRYLADGTRHILETFLPGDVIGLREFPFQERLSSVAMLEDAEIRLVEHRRLVDIFRDSPRLTSLCFAVSSYQQALLSERLVHLSRRSARQRVAYLLFEFYSRLKRNDGALGDCFRVPLSQQQLADALGLSPVHVSRTLTAFRREGLVKRSRGWVHILDPQALADEGCVTGYLHESVLLVD
ncbi:Crp/Fnr family transcriptional regulator [Salinicola rhizosphaerae]|uniref:Crp/Fnr family transcriptional regulator n=1 Tax=Salinicola rhizosphaerae TaxID=1443141 RepID=A0ABQ3E1M1_9GAMM|nr:Crp/Fnr family transcriptional regulator [Salinicola rhizosphaerae]GHB22786.1 Crp/Fnr family transcriptional regulator [Salinicola rhizosphaerae]